MRCDYRVGKREKMMGACPRVCNTVFSSSFAKIHAEPFYKLRTKLVEGLRMTYFLETIK
jgi:hypothetical protein